MLSTVGAHRLRLLLAVLVTTSVLVLAAIAIFLVVGAMTAGSAAGQGVDGGALY
jgi:hypothetical protein